MKLLIVLLFAVGFYWLAQYSLHQTGYTKSEREAMDQLVATLQYDDTPESKAVYLWGDGEKF